MNSRERVLKVIGHEEADRVPMFMDCTTDDKLNSLINYCDVNNEEELLEKLHIDCRWSVCFDDVNPVNEYKEGTYIDMWGVKKSIYGGMPVKHPLKKAETIEDIENYSHWPSPDQIDYELYINKMDSAQDYCVFGGLWSSFAYIAQQLLSMEKFMIKMIESPKFINYLLDKICDFYLEANETMFEKAGDKMDIFFMGDDYGTQEDLLISPDLWKQFIKPRLEKFYNLAKSYDYKVMQHSCGSVVKIIPDFIEIGLDGLQPIQVSAKGMDPGFLKEQFGDDLYFMGSVDVQNTLINGTVEEIETEVNDRIEVLGKNGGFILGPSSGFNPEVSDESIVKMYEAGYKFGFYE